MTLASVLQLCDTQEVVIYIFKNDYLFPEKLIGVMDSGYAMRYLSPILLEAEVKSIKTTDKNEITIVVRESED